MKKVLSILLCITLLFSLGAIVVQAIPAGDLWVNGEDYYSSESCSGTGWTWSGSTLTLTNYSGDFIQLPEGKDVTINFSGSNTITSETYGINIDAATLTLSGSGTLTINATDSAIRGDNTSTVKISSGTYELISSAAEAVRIDGTLTVNGDTVHAKTSANAPAIVVYGFKLYDNIGKAWLDEVDTHAINFGTNVAYTNSSIKNVDLSLDKTSEGYNDYYDDYYDSSYYSDPGGTGAKWNRSYQYKLIVSATANDVTLDTTNSAWTYAGSYSKDVTIKKNVTTDKITPKSGSIVKRETLAGSSSDVLVITLKERVKISISQFISGTYLTNQTANLKVFNANGTSQITSGNICTCYIVKLYDSPSSTTPIDQCVVVLKGDVNSDGDVSLQDYGKIKEDTKPKSTKRITNIYQRSAADFNLDGDVTLQDYGKIKTFTKPKVK